MAIIRMATIVIRWTAILSGLQSGSTILLSMDLGIDCLMARLESSSMILLKLLLNRMARISFITNAKQFQAQKNKISWARILWMTIQKNCRKRSLCYNTSSSTWSRILATEMQLCNLIEIFKVRMVLRQDQFMSKNGCAQNMQLCLGWATR